MQNFRNRLIIGFVLVFGIYVVLLLVFDSTGQFSKETWNTFKQFPLWLVPVILLTQVSAGIFRFLEWHYYLGVINARAKLSLKDSIIIFVAGFIFAVSPGKAAEVLKAVLLKLKTGVPVVVSAPIVFAERVVDGLAVILTLFFTLLIAGDQVQLGEYRAISQGVVFTSTALLVGGLIVVQIAPLAYFCLNLLQRIPILSKTYEPLLRFYESSREIFKLKHIIPTTILGMGVYISSAAGYTLVLWGFGLDITWTLILQVAFIVGVVSAIGAVSFTPNGAGITEVSNLAMLNAIIGVTNPLLTVSIAAAASIIQSFLHKWFRVVVGLIVAIIYRKQLFTSEFDEELSTLSRPPQQPESYQQESSYVDVAR